MNETHFEVFAEKPYEEGDVLAEPEYAGPTGRYVWHFKDANGRITATEKLAARLKPASGVALHVVP